VGARKVGCWHDAAHAARLGALGVADPRDWLARAGAATLGVTVCDWSPPVFGGGGGGRTPPGAGTVDWAGLRSQLAAPMLRVLRLPPDLPAAFVGDALREAARLTGA